MEQGQSAVEQEDSQKRLDETGLYQELSQLSKSDVLRSKTMEG